jgi:hypothetical protein
MARGECFASKFSFALPVMAGLVPAIHVLGCGKKGMDARIKSGHDDIEG